jgi:hypothetical protein
VLIICTVKRFPEVLGLTLEFFCQQGCPIYIEGATFFAMPMKNIKFEIYIQGETKVLINHKRFFSLIVFGGPEALFLHLFSSVTPQGTAYHGVSSQMQPI